MTTISSNKIPLLLFVWTGDMGNIVPGRFTALGPLAQHEKQLALNYQPTLYPYIKISLQLCQYKIKALILIRCMYIH